MLLIREDAHTLALWVCISAWLRVNKKFLCVLLQLSEQLLRILCQEILGSPFPWGQLLEIYYIPLVKEYSKFFMIPLALKRYLCNWGGSHFFQTLQINCSKRRLSLEVGDTVELTGTLSPVVQGA